MRAWKNVSILWMPELALWSVMSGGLKGNWKERQEGTGKVLTVLTVCTAVGAAIIALIALLT